MANKPWYYWLSVSVVLAHSLIMVSVCTRSAVDTELSVTLWYKKNVIVVRMLGSGRGRPGIRSAELE